MNDARSLSAAAWDSQSLSNLKRLAGNAPQAHAKEVAQQVEGMFVQMMLKSMRDALPKEGLFSSEQSRMFTSLYDQQIAQQMAARGIGLSDSLVRQMQATAPPDEQAGTLPMPLDKQFINTLPPLAMAQRIRLALPRLPPPSAAMSGDSRDFIAQLLQPAQAASAASGIPHHLILAQAALESGWGQRQILTADGKPSFNLFGIKAGASWRGDTTEITTTEYQHGVAKKVKASFRVYGSYFDALADYVRLVGSNPRYAAVASAVSAEEGAMALQQAGYATDPNYAQKLVSVIQQFKHLGERVAKAYSSDLSALF
ncbi:flagellar assembly peptidoglycan hydrolase FlgJ [Pantoea sp. 1.19]|uniref:flagellar assembly peptidoglycan hydrolase FlgJ n=1 Tax=Pantoea sp. 1.19 TaxID=1925589 RepID=UPI000948BD6B|nr:flagellar assembly peptidoglycan hydrolase FlgJ [Pantoea sp. 1.19]